MNHFPDTSFLCALYRTQSNSLEADAFINALPGPLTVSTLLLFEFRQSVRLQMRLFRNDPKKGFPYEEGEDILRKLSFNLAQGALTAMPVNWAHVHELAEGLSKYHTLAHGYRFADILHVATALHLGVEEFLTFDANQKKLAQSEGLRVPF